MLIAGVRPSRHDPDARAYYLRKRTAGKRHNTGGPRPSAPPRYYDITPTGEVRMVYLPTRSV